ncbi:MAG: long-chain-acyl-CoA synthetase [Alphaproteobacteria bacterium]
MVVDRQVTQDRMNLQIMGASKNKPSQTHTVASQYERWANETPTKAAIRYNGQEISYAELNKQANKMAVALNAHGVGRGDVVAFAMENRPEFYVGVVALAKLGAVGSLINVQQKGDRLAYAINKVPPKAIVVGSECLKQVKDACPRPGVPVLMVTDDENPAHPGTYAVNLTAAALAADANDYDIAWRDGLTAGEHFVYVFTSGTTGYPKAAVLSHVRWLNTGDGMSALLQFREDDVFYCVLPLYHSAGLMSLTAMCLSVGGTMALRRKFSVSNFWSDIRDMNCTITQYIGEMCRYLMAQPEQPNDGDNPMRAMIGSSIGMDLWQGFKDRFQIDHIYEGWGATEANTGMTNVDEKIGAVGRVPFKEMSNIRVVKYDMETGEHVRDENGFLIETDDDEVGEVIARILALPDSAAGRFEGYTDKEATDAKTLSDVFEKGDLYFRSGDLMRRDADDYFYFIDRIGDTFRWKSENVSTMEVAEALSGAPGVAFVNCYGVKVPQTEGRAGMVALGLSEGASFDPKAFYEFAAKALPHYAQPLFVRITADMDMTATMKMRKVDFQRQGYDPKAVGEPLFVKLDDAKTYAPLDKDSLAKAGWAAFEGEG